WDVADQESEGDDPRWTTVRSALWPYDWPPIVACQNLPSPNEYWGFGDLEEDVLELSHVLNFVLSNAVRIIRLHAHPKLWGSGFQSADLPLGPEDVTVLPEADSALHLLEMRGDLGSSLELYTRLREALHEMARVPDPGATTAQAAGRLSGVAIRMLHQPIVEKTQTKRTLYGEMLEDLCRRLLALGGFGDGLSVSLEWPSVTPTDPLEEAQTALIHRKLGAEAAPLLRRLGIEPGRRAEPCPDASI
ncbi:MAG: phage portal protein, partial [Armatimonadetes bacterium]|nr:phage portal protein [Armatimonadota bacterium]